MKRAVRLSIAACLCLALAALPKVEAETRVKVIVAFGDSLTAGFGVKQAESFPAQLEAALKARGHAVSVVNAGVSGDTASGGLARVAWSVPDGTDAVILELGANDMLRAVDPKVTREALEKIIAALKGRGIEILFCGMRAAPNLGADYGAAFDAIYPDLAKEHGLIFYPFFLDGVAAQPQFTQADGLHPNAAGVDVIVKRIMPKVEELIARVRAKPRP
jgi:acyl-CoA thioesterase-1